MNNKTAEAQAAPETQEVAVNPIEKDLREVTYESHGETIKLNMATVRNYLTNGDGRATDQECMMFLILCKSKHMNPFLKEAYLIKYSEKYPASIVVGKDYFMRVAKAQKDYNGFKAGIILKDTDGKILKEIGSFYDKEVSRLVGGWCEVYIKDVDHPIYNEVMWDEYVGKKDGKPNKMWAAKGATMIRKVAVVQSMREAYPEKFGGLLDSEVEVIEDTQIKDPKGKPEVVAPTSTEDGK